MMKLAVISFLLAVTAVSTWSVAAFNPSFQPKTSTSKTTTTTQLDMASYSRRNAIKQALISVSTAAVIVSGTDNNSIVANAFSQQLDDYAYEPQQQATGGKWDLNSVFVGDYKAMPGMYPHAAGKIASNGPYKKVSDIYRIEGINENDKKLFKKYQKYFTVNPPGRSFYERINNRVST